MPDIGEAPVLTIEIKNGQPVDLVDLTTSLMAVAQDFMEFSSGADVAPGGELRLYVRELRSGSIIADLIPMAEQVSWVLDHKELLGAFITHIEDLAQFFLGERSLPEPPSTASAERLAKIVEPIAKDGASQLNIQASDSAKVEVHQHFHLGSRDANAIQNGIKRFVAPALPASEIHRDRLLVLEQIKNATTAKTGDRGIIESIWPRPVKLIFLSEEAKQKVLSQPENPFQSIFIVDVEVQAVGGKPALYRIIEVKGALDRPS